MNEVYYIGGSPCSGKSTVAEALEKQYGLAYYKLDDKLFDYMAQAARDGQPNSAAQMAMELEEMWMRPPAEQCAEELATYEELLPYVMADVAQTGNGGPVVAEGAGFVPALMRGLGVDAAHYVCIAPTEAFQREKYAQRPWIGQYLTGCADPDTAFDNWMSRDALFALEVLRQANSLGYTGITVDGSRGVEEITAQVAALFGLNGG